MLNVVSVVISVVKRKLKQSKFQIALLLIAGGAVAAGFQNCSPVKFQTSQSSLASTATQATVPTTITPQFAEETAGATTFPPLKLIFVVDNSATMMANQINLSQAFSQLFSGSNASNLSHFDTTIYLISTSQKSLDQSSNVFSRLPSATLAQLTQSQEASLVSQHRGTFIDGFITGDLVGFQVQINPLATVGYNQLAYLPSTVLGLAPASDGTTIVSFGIHKGPQDSVDSMKTEFNNRMALLSPLRSAIDPTTNQGVLDAVINTESGMCALARMLRHNQNFLNPGDLAAYVLVSDEDDNDPRGANCIDSYTDMQGNTDLVDGQCTQSWTNLSYLDKNPNPQGPQCQVTYNTGFNYHYVYNQPQTNVTYYTASQSYDVPQTSITYQTMSQSYQILQTAVIYYTKSQSYDVPQSKVTYTTVSQSAPYTNVSYYTSSQSFDLYTTNVTYFTQAQTCQVRDGATLGCVYQTTKTFNLVGDYHSSGCAAFTSGKLPTDALQPLDAQHQVSCAAGALQHHANEACVSTDSTKLNCQTTYTQNKLANPIQGDASLNSCASLYAGKLPSGAILNDSVNAPITCSAAAAVTKPGLCPATGVLNCSNVYSSSITTGAIDGDYTGAGCAAFATAKANLPSNVVTNDANHAISCTATSRHVASGSCSPTDATVKNCTTNYTKQTPVIFAGDSSVKGCAGFVATQQMPAGAILNDSTNGPISCDNTVPPISKNGACPANDPTVTNCNSTYTSASVVVAGQPADTSAQACSTLAVSSGKIPNGGLTAVDPNHGPTCAAAAAQHITGSTKSCDQTLLNCTTNFTSNTAANLVGDFTAAGGCDAFVAAPKLPPGAILNDPQHKPSCVLGSPVVRSIDGSELFTASQWANYTPTAGASCSADLVTYIGTKNPGVAAPTSCTVSYPSMSTKTFTNSTCQAANPSTVCSNSSGADRNCSAGVDIAASSPWMSVPTVLKVAGTVTCNTPCAQAHICTDTQAVTLADNFHNCSTTALADTVASSFNGHTASDPLICAMGTKEVISKGPYRTKQVQIDYVAGQGSLTQAPNALANYIQSRSQELFNQAVPATSIFVRERSSNDPLGQAGSYGDSYDFWADLMGGQKQSVLLSDYSSSLQSLSEVIHANLERSFVVQGVQPTQQIHKAWYRAAGATDWGSPIDDTAWTSSGGTVTILPGFDFHLNDQFRFEYY